MDLPVLVAMGGPMTGEVNEDALALCRALCTRAGMLFEDANAKVVLVGNLQRDELRGVIEEVRIMSDRADALLAAAGTLLVD